MCSSKQKLKTIKKKIKPIKINQTKQIKHKKAFIIHSIIEAIS